MFTIGNPLYSAWPAAAKLEFAKLGVSIAQLEAYPVGTPFVIFGRKGSPEGSAKVFTTSASPSNQQLIEVTGTITSRTSSGQMKSSVVGPAQNWQSLKTDISESEDTDLVDFSITGITNSGNEEILFSSIADTKNLSTVSAEQFPYLRINYNTTDDVNLTATQLDKWLVEFTPAPEGLLLFKGPLTPSNLNEGESWTGNYGFTNISDKTFNDSLTVRFEVFNKDRRASEFQQFKIHAPDPGDTTDFQVTVNTLGKAGLNDLNVSVNPEILPEMYYDNNILELTDHLDVEDEAFKPVIHVSIDGRQIENGDIVSTNPSIKIKLWDGNDYIFKTDTLGMRILLTYPCSDNCIAKQIVLSGSDVVVHPASATSDFQIDYNPVGLPEGLYTLQVEASDVKGNKSGAEPYKITFEVKHDRIVTLFPPYPNPSKYEVYFPIEIAGDLLPETVEIIITHVSGQVINELSKESFEDLHSGRNILIWKGTDASGNPLPNGIYIYKEVITLNGQQTTQLGKVVLVR
jgi:hypothetical protein